MQQPAVFTLHTPHRTDFDVYFCVARSPREAVAKYLATQPGDRERAEAYGSQGLWVGGLGTEATLVPFEQPQDAANTPAAGARTWYFTIDTPGKPSRFEESDAPTPAAALREFFERYADKSLWPWGREATVHMQAEGERARTLHLP